MAKLTLEYLDWDSKQLGISCGLIDATELTSTPAACVLADRIKVLCEKKKNLRFITLKLPDDCFGTVNSLVKMGASLIDTELTFCYSKKVVPKNPEAVIFNDLKFSFCKKYDSKAFIPLAKEMRVSRFFLDPKISKKKAINLWESSIKNHCEGFAARLLIAYCNNEPCGIVTLKFKDHKRIFLHIVGVLKKFRGNNIGRFMLMKIAQHYAKNYTIYVETQSNNSAAQYVYQKAGFKYHDLKYILHYWRSERK